MMPNFNATKRTRYIEQQDLLQLLADNEMYDSELPMPAGRIFTNPAGNVHVVLYLTWGMPADDPFIQNNEPIDCWVINEGRYENIEDVTADKLEAVLP